VLCRAVVLLALVRTVAPGDPLMAVEELAPHGVKESDAAIVTDRLRTELLQSAKVRVLERSAMDKILKEQSLESSGACEPTECAVQTGRLLSVDRLVVGAVGKIGETYTLGVRMLDVTTGEVLFAANRDCQGQVECLLTDAIPSLGEKLATAAVESSRRSVVRRGSGDLFVVTERPDAVLTLDGRTVQGHSPFTLEKVKSGEHVLVARAGGSVGTRVVDLEPEELVKVRIDMARGSGKMRIFSDPPGAQVFMDAARFCGTTPLRLDDVPTGSHPFTFRLPGYFAQTKEVEVGLGQKVDLRETLRPASVLHLWSRRDGLEVSLLGEKDTIALTLKGNGLGRSQASAQLVPGSWTLLVRAPGIDRPVRKYDLEAGKEISDTLDPSGSPYWTKADEMPLPRDSVAKPRLDDPDYPKPKAPARKKWLWW
jgi:hypothetical protein